MNTVQIFDLIVNNLTQIIPGLKKEDIVRNAMLSPLGADSIGRAELIESMLEELNLNIPRSEFHGASNLGELADMLAQKLNSESVSKPGLSKNNIED